MGVLKKMIQNRNLLKDFDIDIEEKDIELKEEFNDYGGFSI